MGESVDLLAALQASIDRARAERTSGPAVSDGAGDKEYIAAYAVGPDEGWPVPTSDAVPGEHRRPRALLVPRVSSGPHQATWDVTWGRCPSCPAPVIPDERHVHLPAVRDATAPGDPDLIARLFDLIPAPAVSEHVADWPEDEREYYRDGDWGSFTERKNALDGMRRTKAARQIAAVVAEVTAERDRAVTALGEIAAPAPTGPASMKRIARDALAGTHDRYAELVAEVDRVRQAAATTAHAVTETLGAVLGYARDEDGPVTGELVPEVMAEEAAERIRRLTEEGEALREVVREAAALQEEGRDRRDRDREEIERLRAGFRRIIAWLDENQVDGMASVDLVIAEMLSKPTDAGERQ